MLTLWLLVGCSPELTLTVPEDPVSGEVELCAQGEFERLVLRMDGQLLYGGEGPSLCGLWDSSAVADGTHQFRGVGFVGSRAPVEVVVPIEVDQLAGDDTAPVLSFLVPESDENVSGDQLFIQFSITEAVGLAEVSLHADGGLLALLPTAGPWEVVWEDVEEGEHCLEAFATDIAGNIGEAGVCFEVSAEGEEIECVITSPEDGEEVEGEVQFEVAAGAENGISEVEFFADGEEIGSLESWPWHLPWDSSDYAGSSVVLSIQVRETAGSVCTDAVTVEVLDEER